jgi:hypothetical protein
MRKGLLFVMAIALLLLPCVSAAISISEPDSVYSFGDVLTTGITVSEDSTTNAFLTLDITCDEETSEIYKAPMYIPSGEEKSVEISAMIDSVLFEDMTGDCELEAKYNDETEKTSQFTISNTLLVSVSTDENEVDPGSTITISGSAVRESGTEVTGKAEISIEDTDLSGEADIENGEFSIEIELPGDMAAGEYTVNILAEEYDSADNVINSGEGSAAIRVNQIIKDMEIELSDITVNPGEDVNFKVKLLDQTGQEADGDVVVVIIFGNQTIANMIVQAGEEEAFRTEKNYSAGIWKMEATVGEFSATKEFGINELAAIDTRMENNTLIVTNVGNIPFQKEISVMIGNQPENVSIDLPLGAVMSMKLFAPDGDYNISVADGESTDTFTGVALTGHAIGINSDGSLNLTYIIWAIIIIVCLAVAVYYFRKVQKSNGFALWRLRGSGKSNVEMPKTVAASKITSATTPIGAKQEVAVVAMKIKNYDEVYSSSSTAPEVISKAIQTAKQAGATVTSNDSYTIMYFKDSAGKESKELKAVKIAKEIESLLKSHNRKYAKKIMFGIGVHADTFIVETRAGTSQFTPLGTGLSYARKIAENSNEAVLLSDVVHERTRIEVKVDKSIGGMFWNVRAFTARSTEHEEFIKRFMSRNKFETY